MPRPQQLSDNLLRLAAFKVFAGAPAADVRPPDHDGLEEARDLIPAEWRGRGSKTVVPLGVIHPAVVNNPDDGIYRNCYAKRELYHHQKHVNIALRAEVFAAGRGLCSYCDLAIPDVFQCDHVWPAQHGGITALPNLALSCGPCNMAAGRQRTPTVWLRRAYVRAGRKGIPPDTRETLALAAQRFIHLHTELR